MTNEKGKIQGPDNLVAIFEESVKKHGDNNLFGTKNKAKDGYDWVTYKEVGKRVDNFRSGLASIGVKKGDGVAIIANNRTEWAVAAYATYGLGARFIPMYEAELVRIMQFIIEDSGAKVLLVSKPEIYEKVRHFPEEIPGLEKVFLIEGTGENSMAHLEAIGAKNPVPSIQPSGSDIAGLIYTSGTTGNPKGVLLSHLNLSSNVLACAQAYPLLKEDDRTLSFLPWAHSFGQTAELHFLVLLGASTGFAEGPTTIVNDLALVRPTLLIAVPRVFNRVYDGLNKKFEDDGGLGKFLFQMGLQAAQAKRAGKAGLLDTVKLMIADKIVFSKIRAKFGGRLRMSLSSSAALSPKIAEFFQDMGIALYEAWGMTELSPAHTVNTPLKNKPGSVGFAIPGSRVVIDKTLTGEESKDGEIIAYGPNVMVGYHNLPEQTKEVLREDGGLHTGDRGWIDSDGFLFITGRIKEQYKLENGKYIFPAALEESIKLSPYIEHIMVEGANKPFNVAVVVPDWTVVLPWAKEKGLPEDPKALAKEQKLEALLLAEIDRACKEYAKYETPKKIVISEEGFSTENGILTPTLKLKRREVMKRYGDRLEALYQAL